MIQFYLRGYRLLILGISSLVLSIFLQLGWVGFLPIKGAAQSLPTPQLVQQGIEQYQAGDFLSAIASWQQALEQTTPGIDRATIHNNLAQAYQQVGQNNQAIAQWNEAIQIYQTEADAESQQILAKVLVEQAQAYGSLGQYRHLISLLGCVLEEAETAPFQLESCALETRGQPNPQVKAAAWGMLGNAYTVLGDYTKAQSAYELSLDLAESLRDAQLTVTALNNLGNLYIKQSERYRFQAKSAELEGETRLETHLTQQVEGAIANAQQAYQRSWQMSQSIGGLAEATALINLINLNRLKLQFGTPINSSEVVSYATRIEQLLRTVPDSQAKAFALINLAMQFTPLTSSSQMNPDVTPSLPQTYSTDLTTQPNQPNQPNDNWQYSQRLLNQAWGVANAIGDGRAESFALGSLGRLEEIVGNYEAALKWTRQAQLIAQEAGAPISLYLWQWQSGRIFRAIGAQQEALESYNQAVATLQNIRGDIVSASQDLQFNFRDAVEPVYREQMELLLDVAEAEPLAGEKEQEDKTETTSIGVDRSEPTVTDLPETKIHQVLDTLDLLKLSELQNFFGDECVQIAQTRVEQETQLADASAAVLYSVILEQRTEMILRAPDGRLTHYPVKMPDGSGDNMPASQFRQEIDRLRGLLEKRTTDEYLRQAEKVYDLILRPLEADLVAASPRTLVLVNDSVLRNIPLAALRDSKTKQFLVEKYAITTTPSLSLTTGTPMQRRNLKALILGLTEAQPPFPPLTYVAEEAEGVRTAIGGVELLNQDFTTENLKAQLQQQYYPIVHIATHGRFGVDAESTFLLAHDNKKLKIEDIDTLLQPRSGAEPVELLTLSSCQTAAGDDRTTLGIAGVAVRAGVKSALATLWYINDAATVPLIELFYEKLRQPELTKAEALQQAQQSMLNNPDHPEYRHPAVWAPFILVGNWL